jgi:hypothetical protein
MRGIKSEMLSEMNAKAQGVSRKVPVESARDAMPTPAAAARDARNNVVIDRAAERASSTAS